MKVYLVSCCNLTSYKKLIKLNDYRWRRIVRSEEIQYQIETSPLWVTKTKEMAIKDCRERNKKNYMSDTLYFFTEIKFYL